MIDKDAEILMHLETLEVQRQKIAKLTEVCRELAEAAADYTQMIDLFCGDDYLRAERRHPRMRLDLVIRKTSDAFGPLSEKDSTK